MYILLKIIELEVPEVVIEAEKEIIKNETKKGEEIELTVNDNKNVSARVASISSLGEVVIEFNATMDDSVNLTMLNSSVLDLYIVPALSREGEEDFNLSQVNFTWVVTKFESPELELKLNFSYPLFVSPLEVQDSLVFHVKEWGRPLFYSTSSEKYLHENYWTLKRKVRKQMPDNMLSQSLQSGAGNSKIVLLALIAFTFFLNFALSGGMKYMVTLIRGLQIVLHLPLLKILMPANVCSLCS